MTDVDDFLAHHGVKGMKWGVHKREESGPGRQRKAKVDPKTKLSPLEHEILGVAAKQGMTEERMNAKFGPESESPKTHRHLTPGEKKALKVAIGVGVGAAALYGLNRYGNSLMVKQQLGEFSDSKKLGEFWKGYQKSAGKMFMSEEDVSHLSTERVRLSAGSILKRISTQKETEIRPGGFYAAHREEDVNRYKAVLPVFWKVWGIDTGEGGHVVNIQAKQSIVAPSHKETFELFKEFLESPVRGDVGGKNRDMFDPNAMRELMGFKPGKHIPTDELARKTFRQAALGWANDKTPATDGFFEFVKGKGFNALIDHNDAGHLADQPLRLLDGSMFEIAGHERLTHDGIRAAQESLVKVVHAIVDVGIRFVNEILVRSGGG